VVRIKVSANGVGAGAARLRQPDPS